MKAPPGAKSIGIEAIHDTGKMVLPHEILWQELQRQFAINGRLIVVPVHKADLYLRAHIISASIDPLLTEERKTMEPDSFFDFSSNPAKPLAMKSYPNYNIASSYPITEALNVEMGVELWDLHRNKKVFWKNYSVETTWTVYDASLPPEYTFLQTEETFEAAFLQLSQQVSRKIIKDMFRADTPGL